MPEYAVVGIILTVVAMISFFPLMLVMSLLLRVLTVEDLKEYFLSYIQKSKVH